MLICMRTQKGGLACGQLCMTDLGFGGMVAALNTDVAINITIMHMILRLESQYLS